MERSCGSSGRIPYYQTPALAQSESRSGVILMIFYYCTGFIKGPRSKYDAGVAYGGDLHDLLRNCSTNGRG